jgi:signal transduction histidine kinase
VAGDLVRQAGGEIRVASKVGHGSTFTVLLPIAEEAE